MKHFIFFVFMISIFSCQLQNTMPEKKAVLPERFFNHEIFNPSYKGDDSHNSVVSFLRENINPTIEDIDEWVDPEITFIRGWGDCDDFCLTFSSTVYTSFGDTPSILLVSRQNQNKITHAVVRYRGKIVDPQTGVIYPDGFLKIYYELGFFEVFTV